MNSPKMSLAALMGALMAGFGNNAREVFHTPRSPYGLPWFIKEQNFFHHTPRHSKANQRQALKLRRLKRHRRLQKATRHRHTRTL